LGDRGGVLIRTEDDFVFLYTHLYGSFLISDVKNGLKKLFNDDKHKIDEADRVAAYIFKEMVENYDSANLVSATISGFGYETLEKYHGLRLEDNTLKEIYGNVNGKDLMDARVLIIIDGEDLIIKNLGGDFLDVTNLKDFMLTSD